MWGHLSCSFAIIIPCTFSTMLVPRVWCGILGSDFDLIVLVTSHVLGWKIASRNVAAGAIAATIADGGDVWAFWWDGSIDEDRWRNTPSVERLRRVGSGIQ